MRPVKKRTAPQSSAASTCVWYSMLCDLRAWNVCTSPLLHTCCSASIKLIQPFVKSEDRSSTTERTMSERSQNTLYEPQERTLSGTSPRCIHCLTRGGGDQQQSQRRCKKVHFQSARCWKSMPVSINLTRERKLIKILHSYTPHNFLPSYSVVCICYNLTGQLTCLECCTFRFMKWQRCKSAVGSAAVCQTFKAACKEL